MEVHLSVPKFDVSADLNLMSGLEQLGIRKAMSYEQADFSTLCDNPDGHIWLGRAQQGIRVAIDEDGLTGAAYTILVAPNDGAPLMEEIDFVLDRPFLFVVESSDGLPLFTGIVNNP
jgi:serine protease inhibitor